MARWLTLEWFEEVKAAARASHDMRERTARTALTIQQVLTGGPSGDVHYWVRVDHGAVEAGPGEDDGATVTITQPYETALAIGRGELSPQGAFLTGRIRVTGDVGALMAHQSALQGVDVVFEDVRHRTAYE